MKRIFYLGIFLLILFELANIYFIMPMPGSQEMDSISFAYFLHSWQGVFRIVFGLMILAGLRSAWNSSKWFASIALLIAIGAVLMINFKMKADRMFLQPGDLIMKSASENVVDPDRLILGVEHNGEAKAYPIQYIGYHHQVSDSIGGKPMIITYCTVCRSGRVYVPLVNGKYEKFRLVGMDHFNALFEDHATKTWWRQATGEAVAGPLKGMVLPEWPSTQMSLSRWLELYPASLIMQPDSAFSKEYKNLDEYEGGRKEGKLTRYDTTSWNEKSWIAGIEIGNESKAYDWNELKAKQIIHDSLGSIPVLIVVTDQNKGVFAYVRNAPDQLFQIQRDTLRSDVLFFDLLGRSLVPGAKDLDRINVYQEYWHSWRTFHPHTQQFNK